MTDTCYLFTSLRYSTCNFYFSAENSCDAGYYKDGDDCVLCTGNTIKPNSGDDPDCPTSCDGIMKVANDEHTACSKSRNYHAMTLIKKSVKFCCVIINCEK